MTKDHLRNVAASVRQRLMNKAREQKEDFGTVLPYMKEQKSGHFINASSVSHIVLIEIPSDRSFRELRDELSLGTRTVWFRSLRPLACSI